MLLFSGITTKNKDKEINRGRVNKMGREYSAGQEGSIHEVNKYINEENVKAVEKDER